MERAKWVLTDIFLGFLVAILFGAAVYSASLHIAIFTTMVAVSAAVGMLACGYLSSKLAQIYEPYCSGSVVTASILTYGLSGMLFSVIAISIAFSLIVH